MLSFDDLMSHLESLAKTTACLWLDALIRPVFIIMRFVRSCREVDWPLHIHNVQTMLPYFAAAGHWHYLHSTVMHLIKMTKLPKDLVQKFIKGEHAMRHQKGLWNSIWSDMMIETTSMRYGHGPAGMKGITLNENDLGH